MDKDRRIWIGKRLALVAGITFLALLLFAVGLMVGYSVIGEGDNAFAALSPSKWQELFGKFTGK